MDQYKQKLEIIINKNNSQLNIEDLLMTLEEVTTKLQSGSLTLQESIDLYESGIKIAKDLEKQLSVAESNIDTLRNQLTNINLDSNEDD